MSSASLKKIASANTEVLNQLLILQVIIHLLVLIIYLIFKRPLSIKPYIFFNIPNFLLHYHLETLGRPKYVNKTLKVGTDLNQKGLIEYYFDVIYITDFFNVLMTIFASNKVWYGYLIIPGYIGYVLSGYILPYFRKSNEATVESDPVDSNSSKRQQKLQARKVKGQSVKYR